MKVSVVIPCYNAERFIAETIQSVIAQSFEVAEIIVVDDGSTDRSAEIASSQSSLVRVLTQENQGESVARNNGMDAAMGDLIAFLDADDLWEPKKIEMQVAGLSDADVGICTGYEKVSFGSQGQRSLKIELPDLGDLSDKLIVECGSPVHISSLVVRSDTTARFPTWTQYSEDSIFLMSLLKCGPISSVQSPLTKYRVHDSNQSGACDIALKRAQAFYRWVNEFSGVVDRELIHELEASVIKRLRSQINRAYWTRDWETYRFLVNALRSFPLEVTGYKKKLFPDAAYRIRDWASRSN